MSARHVTVNISPAAFVAGAVAFAFLGCYGLAAFSLVCAFVSC